MKRRPAGKCGSWQVSKCVVREEQVLDGRQTFLPHGTFRDPDDSFVYFLAEEEITFSKIETPKKSELFAENLRYGRV